ncbi:hypothetical protein AYO21_00302 [Fonsecaea monophora]|uniref:DNA mismatch repair protein S5 domain-containing protein n=1 Tax=Fonsecaea monophora TaxID=254056 RepID=A0A177FPM2_9EURO|nr:hypothetical protein AYO21_00302 [Fonsecaea monophora]KAH0832798.1 DNA mismatch repair protein MutL [Fonsecaea pedrosoi]OAG45666.1 hypothetical protein AYO21_00302 [Fonsecaea monophora]
MPIQALPENTTRLLGSSLALTDARSVVKELVDNALDARATAISVEISNNTLDVIQVKDNGTGIGIQDRQLLCKRGCTSKITSMEDLESLGGSSLGFRGEALASIVELSQAVVITTRVDGEVVGTSIKYAASGMLSSSSASHPVGTTIRVQDFLSKLPVRKQTALKESMKTLQAIRLLLFSFAFARPEVRLSLRVLKGKNDKLNWTYAPTLPTSMTEVATKIVGKEVVSECTAHSITPNDCDVDLDSGWKINALLLSTAPGSANARNAKQYISIDGRPVNADRGTIREVTKSYKRHLQKTLPLSESSSVSRPFLFMQIQCPSQSYDVNLEPTKDEVLFARPDQLLSLVEFLFGRAYPDLEDHGVDAAADGRATSLALIATSNTSREDLVSPEEDGHSLRDDNVLVTADKEESLTCRSALRNPFTIAAMNAQVKPRRMRITHASATSDGDPNTLPDEETVERLENDYPTVTPSKKHSEAPQPEDLDLSTTSFPRPGPPTRHPVKQPRTMKIGEPHTLGVQERLTSIPGLHRPTGSNDSCKTKVSDLARNALSVLEMRAESYVDPLSPPLSSQAHRGWGPGQKPFKVPLIRSGQAASSVAAPLTPPSSLRDYRQLSLQRDLRGLPVVSDEHGSDFDQHSQVRSTESSRRGSPANHLLQPNAELDEIMDFEYRKKAAIAHQRRTIRGLTAASFKEGIVRPAQPASSSVSPSPTVETEPTESASAEDYGAKFDNTGSRVSMPLVSNPHRNRYLKALEDLSHSHPHPPPELRESDEQSNLADTAILENDLGKSKLAADDPRAYLMKMQRHKNGNGKIYRTKSSKLPLEAIPSGSTTCNLVLTLNDFKDAKDVYKQLQALGSCDPYPSSSRTQYIDFDDCNASIDGKWLLVLQKMVKTKFRYKTEDGGEGVPEDLVIVVTKIAEE